MEVGKEADYILIAKKKKNYIVSATTRMTPALRGAAMRAILMFH